MQQWPVERSLVLAAALLKANYAIAYADAFAVGLAQQLKLPVVTGDPEFQEVTALIEIVWLPQK
jgi:predicted nucleic acid-binding protein